MLPGQRRVCRTLREPGARRRKTPRSDLRGRKGKRAARHEALEVGGVLKRLF